MFAVREMPEDTLKHFEAARKMTPISSPLHGWAWFNHAFALYMNGQYADAAESYNDLLHKNNPAPFGFDRRVAAYRLRHTGACAASHDALSELGIPRPRKIDVLCVVAGLAISLKAHKLPSDKRLMKSMVRYTGRGSNAQDIVDACDKTAGDGQGGCEGACAGRGRGRSQAPAQTGNRPCRARPLRHGDRGERERHRVYLRGLRGVAPAVV